MSGVLRQLVPILVLSLVYALTSDAVAAASLTEAPLLEVMSFFSLAVAWLGYSICLPLYRRLGACTSVADRANEFVGFLPTGIVWAGLAFGFAALAATPKFSWSDEVIAAVVLLGVLHALSLLLWALCAVLELWSVWLAGWVTYGLALFGWPAHPWFAPLAAQLVMSVFIGFHLRSIPLAPRWKLAASDGRGALTGLSFGAILWMERLFALLQGEVGQRVSHLFLTMLPALVVLTVFNVRVVPVVAGRMEELYKCFRDGDFSDLRLAEARCSRAVQSGFQELLGVGLGTCVLTSGLLSLVTRATLATTLWCVGATLAALAIALLSLLVLLEEEVVAWVFSLSYLLVAGVVASAGIGENQVHSLLATALFLCILVLRVRRDWNMPSYFLYWRKVFSW